MYRKLNNNASLREIAEVVNRILDGGVNSVGSITLGSGTETMLYDERIGYNSVILFTARGTNTFNLPFVKSKTKGKAIIGLEGLVGSVTFDYVVLG